MSPSDRRFTGLMLVAFAVLNLAAVVLLSVAFGWPAVLGEPAAVTLTAFDGAAPAIVTGFMLQTLLSVALIPIAIGLHRVAADRIGTGSMWLPTVTAFGILSALTQTLGWIRWPLVVPGLAATWLDPPPARSCGPPPRPLTSCSTPTQALRSGSTSAGCSKRCGRSVSRCCSSEQA